MDKIFKHSGRSSIFSRLGKQVKEDAERRVRPPASRSSANTDGRAPQIKESLLNSDDSSAYVETRAEKRGVALLKKNGIVIIVGSPGSGKTTLALNMIKHIAKEEKRGSYIVTHHSDFKFVPVLLEKTCILIDDIFGKTNLVLNFVSCWEQLFPEVWSLVENQRVRCIITLRKQIFTEVIDSLKEFDLFNENHLLDLQSDEYCLDGDEKKEILNKYLEQKIVTMDQDDKETVICCSCTELGFPQVCVYYVNSSDAQKRGVKFFEKPVEYLRQELENLIKDETLQLNYLVLLLILFQQGSLSIDSLDSFENDIDSDIMKLIRLLERVCLSVKNTDVRDIKKIADGMCGTYLKCGDNKYTFIHQSVFDSLFLVFSSQFPKKAAELLELCPVSMLLEYVVTPGVSNRSHITMTVRSDCFDVLARRFTDLLASRKDKTIFSHPSLKDEEFVKYLIEEKYFNDKLSEILEQALDEHAVTYFKISSVNVDTADEIFSTISCLLDSDSEYHSSYIWQLQIEHIRIVLLSVPSWCTVNGIRTLSRFFAEHLCKMKLTDLKKELLHVACWFGDEDIVRMLLKSGIIPPFDILSAAACSKTDSVTIIKELLRCKKAMELSEYSHLLLVSICSCNMKIACFLADIIKNEKHTSEIKEKAIKVLLVRFLRRVVLESDFNIGDIYLEISEVVDVSHVFRKLVTIDIINKIEDIAIIAACQSTSSVLKEIVKLKPDCLNDDNRDKVLLAAAIWGVADTVNFLIEQRCNGTDENWNKSQVLKVAVMFNSADVVQCLLDKGADPNVNVAVNEKLMKLYEEETILKLQSDPNNISQNEDLVFLEIFKPELKELFEDQTELDLFLEDKLLILESPLHFSVLRGDLDMIKSLIERNANVNAVNSEGETPLHQAVKRVTHRKEVALLLLENGADINLMDDDKNSALHIASLIDIDVVKEVIEIGVEINAINTKGKTPLHLSLYHNRTEIALYLLNHEADPNLTDSNNNSALHFAAEHGNVEIVTALIEKGIDVNIKNDKGETPLITALNSDKNKVVLILLNHEADPNLTDSNNNSALHFAAEHGNVEIVTALIEKGIDVNIKNDKGETPLITALNADKNKVVLFLLDHGADRNQTDNDNNSILHVAAKQENLELVTALIEKGFDVNIKNGQGETPLLGFLNYYNDLFYKHPAVYYENNKIVSYLLEHGADPNLTDSYNNSALHLAANHGNMEIVTTLIEKGVDINSKNCKGETPLLIAVNCKHKVILHLLEEADYLELADAKDMFLHLAARIGNMKTEGTLDEIILEQNIKNTRHEKPIYLALTYIKYFLKHAVVYRHNNKIVFYLLEQGADHHLTDNDNNSVLHIAAECGDTEIVKALIEKGVDVNVVNSSGETPLDKAKSCRFLYSKMEIVSCLLEHGAKDSE